MFCSISGQVPEHPVVTKHGHVFEKRLLEKHLASTGRCPVTNEQLEKEDIIEVQNAHMVAPRPVQATSIPGMLKLFQAEWDTLVLESHKLKQQLEQTRQELSHALYQHDAACRVIARLMAERDDARQLLERFKSQAPTGVASHSQQQQQQHGADSMEVDSRPAGLTEEVLAKMTETAKKLTAQRKKRVVPESMSKPEDVRAFAPKGSHPLHKASQPGILCVDTHASKANLVMTGGSDGVAVVFDRVEGKVVNTLRGHSKKVTDVAFHTTRDAYLTASADKTMRLWNAGDASVVATFDSHADEVLTLSLHPSGDYAVTASSDHTWGFHDLLTGSTVVRVPTPAGGSLTCARFHPDGLLLCTGTASNAALVWDVKQQKVVASFEGHSGPVNAVSFSENGFALATCCEGAVKLWDLRKVAIMHTIPVEGNVTSVAYDSTASSYLAYCGDEIRVLQVKGFEQLCSFAEHKSTVTAVKFGPDAQYLASTSMDRYLKLYSK